MKISTLKVQYDKTEGYEHQYSNAGSMGKNENFLNLGSESVSLFRTYGAEYATIEKSDGESEKIEEYPTVDFSDSISNYKSKNNTSSTLSTIIKSEVGEQDEQNEELDWGDVGKATVQQGLYQSFGIKSYVNEVKDIWSSFSGSGVNDAMTELETKKNETHKSINIDNWKGNDVLNPTKNIANTMSEDYRGSLGESNGINGWKSNNFWADTGINITNYASNAFGLTSTVNTIVDGITNATATTNDPQDAEQIIALNNTTKDTIYTNKPGVYLKSRSTKTSYSLMDSGKKLEEISSSEALGRANNITILDAVDKVRQSNYAVDVKDIKTGIGDNYYLQNFEDRVSFGKKLREYITNYQQTTNNFTEINASTVNTYQKSAEFFKSLNLSEDELRLVTFLKNKNSYNKKLGYISIIPFTTYGNTGELDDFYQIPFEFNPEISEGPTQAKYQSEQLMNRLGQFHVYTGTELSTVTLSLTYFALAPDVISDEDNELLGKQYGTDAWMYYWTNNRIEAIENQLRSLVFADVTTGNYLIKPPLIELHLENKDGADINSVGDLYKYPAAIDNNKNKLPNVGSSYLKVTASLSDTGTASRYKKYIVQSVQFEKINGDESFSYPSLYGRTYNSKYSSMNPMYHLTTYQSDTDEKTDTKAVGFAGYSRRVAFKATLQLVEVTTNFLDLVPDFKAYYDAYKASKEAADSVTDAIADVYSTDSYQTVNDILTASAYSLAAKVSSIQDQLEALYEEARVLANMYYRATEEKDTYIYGLNHPDQNEKQIKHPCRLYGIVTEETKEMLKEVKVTNSDDKVEVSYENISISNNIILSIPYQVGTKGLIDSYDDLYGDFKNTDIANTKTDCMKAEKIIGSEIKRSGTDDNKSFLNYYKEANKKEGTIFELIDTRLNLASDLMSGATELKNKIDNYEDKDAEEAFKSEDYTVYAKDIDETKERSNIDYIYSKARNQMQKQINDIADYINNTVENNLGEYQQNVTQKLENSPIKSALRFGKIENETYNEFLDNVKELNKYLPEVKKEASGDSYYKIEQDVYSTLLDKADDLKNFVSSYTNYVKEAANYVKNQTNDARKKYNSDAERNLETGVKSGEETRDGNFIITRKPNETKRVKNAETGEYEYKEYRLGKVIDVKLSENANLEYTVTAKQKQNLNIGNETVDIDYDYYTNYLSKYIESGNNYSEKLSELQISINELVKFVKEGYGSAITDLQDIQAACKENEDLRGSKSNTLSAFNVIKNIAVSLYTAAMDADKNNAVCLFIGGKLKKLSSAKAGSAKIKINYVKETNKTYPNSSLFICSLHNKSLDVKDREGNKLKIASTEYISDSIPYSVKNIFEDYYKILETLDADVNGLCKENNIELIGSKKTDYKEDSKRIIESFKANVLDKVDNIKDYDTLEKEIKNYKDGGNIIKSIEDIGKSDLTFLIKYLFAFFHKDGIQAVFSSVAGDPKKTHGDQFGIRSLQKASKEYKEPATTSALTTEKDYGLYKDYETWLGTKGYNKLVGEAEDGKIPWTYKKLNDYNEKRNKAKTAGSTLSAETYSKLSG